LHYEKSQRFSASVTTLRENGLNYNRIRFYVLSNLTAKLFKKIKTSQNAARKHKVNKRAVKPQALFYLWQNYNHTSVIFTCFVVDA